MIAVDNLTIRVGTFALERLSFAIQTGEYAVLMGKTGSGKTTLLEALCGLKPVYSGAIRLDGQDVSRLRPGKRAIGYVPQDLALFQTMTVREHFAFALIIRKQSRGEIEKRVGDLAELLGVARLLDRRPAGLSGGEAQRVALGRALAFPPRILLLDEPLSALDDATREEMYALLRLIQKQTGVTTLHITHSMREAEALADRLLVLRDGQVVESACTRPSQLDSSAGV